MKIFPIISLVFGVLLVFMGFRLCDDNMSLSVMGTGTTLVIISCMWLDINMNKEK